MDCGEVEKKQLKEKDADGNDYDDVMWMQESKKKRKKKKKKKMKKKEKKKKTTKKTTATKVTPTHTYSHTSKAPLLLCLPSSAVRDSCDGHGRCGRPRRPTLPAFPDEPAAGGGHQLDAGLDR